MVQFDFNRKLPIVALFTLHAVAPSDASCTALCNDHRPIGSSDGYNITCRDVAKGSWNYKYTDCSHRCGTCPTLCSDGNFNCPPSGWPTYIIILSFLGIMLFLGGVIALGVCWYRKSRTRNRVGDEPSSTSQTEPVGMTASASSTESQSQSPKDPVPVIPNPGV